MGKDAGSALGEVLTVDGRKLCPRTTRQAPLVEGLLPNVQRWKPRLASDVQPGGARHQVLVLLRVTCHLWRQEGVPEDEGAALATRGGVDRDCPTRGVVDQDVAQGMIAVGRR